MKTNVEFIDVCQRAVSCRLCFDNEWVLAPANNIAQPRWVSDGYWTAKPRLMIMMLNPGSGDWRKDDADSDGNSLLHQFRDGEGGLEAYLGHQRSDLPNWGIGGRFLQFFASGIGVNIDQVAFANIAWCATAGNRYPKKMLAECFERHTAPLLRILKPDVVLLSGGKCHGFKKRIEGFVPGVAVIKTLHYAHRKGGSAEAGEIDRVRKCLAIWKEG